MKWFEGMIPVYPVCKQSAQELSPSFFFRYEQERTKTHRKNDYGRPATFPAVAELMDSSTRMLSSLKHAYLVLSKAVSA
jgi:hypothetical protein